MKLLTGENLGRAAADDANAVGDHVRLDHIAGHEINTSGVPPHVVKVANLHEPLIGGFAAVGVGLQAISHTPILTVAALYVEPDGIYTGLRGVDCWDEARDARLYAGPHPVVAHPPCQRWGRFWHGSTRKPHQFQVGEDGGCFKAALQAVRRWGGVLEHPADSLAWTFYGLNKPPREGGWVVADFGGGWTCCVSQGHYGHMAGKRTWLYAHGVELPELRWGDCEQRLHPVALAKHGYAKARRIGMMAMVGGKDKTKIRNATPVEFRDLLLSIAKSASG